MLHLLRSLLRQLASSEFRLPRPKRSPRQRSRKPSKRSPLVLFFLLLLWSLVLGWGLAQASDLSGHERMLAPAPPPSENLALSASIGTVDPVPPSHQLGQTLYLENCATCHIGVPPAVLPSETWRQVLQDSQHYGRQIDLMVDPPRLLVWNYLRDFSRPLLDEEAPPFRVDDSRYFKALHPRVDLPQPTRLDSCLSCHINARQFDFRTLASEWQDAP